MNEVSLPCGTLSRPAGTALTYLESATALSLAISKAEVRSKATHLHGETVHNTDPFGMKLTRKQPRDAHWHGAFPACHMVVHLLHSVTILPLTALWRDWKLRQICASNPMATISLVSLGLPCDSVNCLSR